MLDTPQNRKNYPGKDYSQWTNIEKVAELIKLWAIGEARPDNGCFVEFETLKGNIMMPKFT